MYNSLTHIFTVEQIESYAYLRNGTLLDLSTQHITSCTPNSLQCGGNGGCAGSIPQLGFNYAQLFGITLEADWPYVSGTTGETGACTYDPEVTEASSSLVYGHHF
jgi:hypothetical protein